MVDAKETARSFVNAVTDIYSGLFDRCLELTSCFYWVKSENSLFCSLRLLKNFVTELNTAEDRDFIVSLDVGNRFEGGKLIILFQVFELG